MLYVQSRQARRRFLCCQLHNGKKQTAGRSNSLQDGRPIPGDRNGQAKRILRRKQRFRQLWRDPHAFRPEGYRFCPIRSLAFQGPLRKPAFSSRRSPPSHFPCTDAHRGPKSSCACMVRYVRYRTFRGKGGCRRRNPKSTSVRSSDHIGGSEDCRRAILNAARDSSVVTSRELKTGIRYRPWRLWQKSPKPWTSVWPIFSREPRRPTIVTHRKCWVSSPRMRFDSSRRSSDTVRAYRMATSVLSWL